jgi:hypothetical protein
MRAAFMALAFIAACAAPAVAPPAQGGMQGEDTCRMAAFAHLLGKHESQIDRSTLPQGARVICATCMVTQDYAPARLNIHLSASGHAASMRCG